VDITPYRLDLIIVRETAKRIIDDFDFFGIEISFSGNEQNAYNELTSQLIPLFEHLYSKDRQKLMLILYKIDIAENKLERTKAKFPRASLAEIISHLVVEREMQKVITRRLYSSGSQNL
jgi:hypothetical protein